MAQIQSHLLIYDHLLSSNVRKRMAVTLRLVAAGILIEDPQTVDHPVRRTWALTILKSPIAEDSPYIESAIQALIGSGAGTISDDDLTQSTDGDAFAELLAAVPLLLIISGHKQ